MAWTVRERNKIRGKIKKLPPAIKQAYDLLLFELQEYGPEATGWHHYGKLTSRKGEPERYHCHLNKSGRPIYVVIWRVLNWKIEIMEVEYAGTHEGAKY